MRRLGTKELAIHEIRRVPSDANQRLGSGGDETNESRSHPQAETLSPVATDKLRVRAIHGAHFVPDRQQRQDSSKPEKRTKTDKLGEHYPSKRSMTHLAPTRVSEIHPLQKECSN